jgi:hypothetical protein
VQKTPVRTKIKRKKMFNKGDKVSVLDEALNGVVLSTKGQKLLSETEEGL